MKGARQFLVHILDLVPRKRRMLAKRKEYLLSLSSPQSGTDGPVQGGTTTTQQERYITTIERDPLINRCESFLLPIESGLSSLDSVSRQIVEMIYIDGHIPAHVCHLLDLPPDRVLLLQKRALDILASHVLGPYHEV